MKLVFLSNVTGLILVMLLCCNSGYAQDRTQAFLKQIRDANNSSRISYSYKVSLVDAAEGKVIDSTVGRLYKNGKQYIDSNNGAVSAYLNGYFCKINHAERSAAVYNVANLKRKLGLKESPDNAEEIFVLSDSSIFRNGKLDIQTKPNGNFLVRLNYEGRNITNAVFEINKDYLIVALQFETLESYDESGKAEYKKVFQMYDVRRDFTSTIFNMERLCSIKNNQVTLNSRYKNYKLTSLIN